MIVVGDAGETCLQTKDIGGLHDVHGLPFGNAFLDVDEHNFVGNLSGNQYISGSSAYVAGAHNCYF